MDYKSTTGTTKLFYNQDWLWKSDGIWKRMVMNLNELFFFFPFLSSFFLIVSNDERFLHISRQQGQCLPRWAKAQPPAVKQSCLCPQLGLIFLHTEHFHFYFLFTWLLTSAASMKVASFNSKIYTQNLKNLFLICKQLAILVFWQLWGFILISVSVYLKVPSSCKYFT